MKSIIFFGECMIELRQPNGQNLEQAFAGDVYNAAVYLKRLNPNIQTSLSTCVGQDQLSDAMLNAFKLEGIATDLVLKDEIKVPGLYWIHTDEQGERSFTYWRSDSAAKQSVAHFSPNYIDQLKQADYFFFSGISLAVIENSLRQAFWEVINILKDAGVKIVFDPNYRPKMWSSIEDTMSQYNKAFQAADIALPGIEDMSMLYNIHDIQSTIDFYTPFAIEELVIKDGSNTVHVLHDDTHYQIPITPVENVVDTTSAGDSFNGAYLGARLQGASITDAVQAGALMAGTVIQYPGAIIPLIAHR